MTPLKALPLRETSPAEACVPIDTMRMSRADADATAGVFKALADPARVRIVNLLAASGEPVCVCHLTDLLQAFLAGGLIFETLTPLFSWPTSYNR